MPHHSLYIALFLFVVHRGASWNGHGHPNFQKGGTTLLINVQEVRVYTIWDTYQTKGIYGKVAFYIYFCIPMTA